ncbi:hypothetical protein AURANDRAFT_60459 [Aureococcus anophagefferens]|uniref:Uncharacterized protein n=1 Tax=Aureococcus anophagefferens TaxID=44056 RepID=F0XX80_AURAN|nr:hypothetical protein AURANDRAFT_60459 [Aureococcus anophagefferens]EGB12528.1 hypothetical protein AURANDRAFT_60459 [Aureococcus anophagefferens]|eukprot:XP_009032202.1 hypothetical protein AURANDRAFT_60459 [Aureococcus anophagefferens]
MEARVLLLARAAASAAADRGAQARLPRYADLFSADDSLQRARRPRLQRPAPADRDDSDDADDEREPRNGAEAAARRELQRLGAPSRKRAYSADAPAAATTDDDADPHALFVAQLWTL